jgi:protein-arginine kinase
VQGTSFNYDRHLGYLTSCPSRLGTALAITVTARLAELAKRPAMLDDLASRLGLKRVGGVEAGGVVRLTHKTPMGYTVRLGLANRHCLGA